MKRLGFGILAALAVIAIGGFVLLQAFPGAALAAIQGWTARSAGYETRTVEVDGYTAHYYVAGPETGPVVVLLHGLIDDKNSFVPAAKALSETHRVILPDLQGHGDNAQLPGRDYSISGQVRFLASLLETLDVGAFVLGGNSMGGHVAAAFALSEPGRVQKLMLLNATGMVLDAPPTYSAYPDGIDAAYMRDLYANVFVNPPSIPGPIMRHLGHDLNTKTPFYNQLIEQVVGGDDFRLDERIGSLAVPTLVIWGTEDRLVPLNYGEAYDAALPNSELLVLEAGHAPQLEIPDATGAAMLDFVTSD